MSAVQTPKIGDIPRLKRLWREAFYDTEAETDAFFSYWFTPETALCVKRGGEVESMGYLLPCGELISGAERTKCVQIYAVATAESCRGQGLGTEVTNCLIRRARSLGFGCTALHPASLELFDFYSGRTELRTAFYAQKNVIESPRRASDADMPELSTASSAEYRAMREERLVGTPHIDMSERALDYFTLMGGRLLRLTLRGENVGCAAVERTDGETFVRELLCAESDRERLTAFLASEFSPGRCTALTPQTERGGTVPFGMANIPLHAGAWYGLAFD